MCVVMNQWYMGQIGFWVVNEKKAACVRIYFTIPCSTPETTHFWCTWIVLFYPCSFFTQPVHTCPWVALPVHGKHLTAPDKSSTKSESSGWQRSKPPWRSQTSAGCHLYPHGAHIRDQQEDSPGLRLGHAIGLLSKQHGRIKTELTNRKAYFFSAQSAISKSTRYCSLWIKYFFQLFTFLCCLFYQYICLCYMANTLLIYIKYNYTHTKKKNLASLVSSLNTAPSIIIG